MREIGMDSRAHRHLLHLKEANTKENKSKHKSKTKKNQQKISKKSANSFNGQGKKNAAQRQLSCYRP
jgi:hypothetical protein